MASSINASTLRLTGLSSGLDTESIVDGLLTASKTKLQNAEKQKTLLEWKQSAYKDILNKLNSFQTKYFGTSATSSSASTILGSALTKLGASYSSKYVSVATTSESTAGSIYVADIVSLASSAKLSGAAGVSANPTISVDTGNLADLAGKSMMVTLDGVKKSITFSDKTYTSVQDVRDEMAAQLKTVFGSGKINVFGTGDDIQLATSNSTLQISVPSDATKDPSTVLDFGSYTSNRLSLTSALGSAGLSQDVLGGGDTLDFTINGTSFSFSSTSTMNDIMKSVNASAAGVKMSYSSLTDSFSLTSTGHRRAVGRAGFGYHRQPDDRALWRRRPDRGHRRRGEAEHQRLHGRGGHAHPHPAPPTPSAWTARRSPSWARPRATRRRALTLASPTIPTPSPPRSATS